MISSPAISRAARRARAFICCQRLPPSFESSGLLAAADVAGDLRQLLRRDEDLVAVAVLELEVVAGDPGDGARVEAGEAGDAVVLVDDVVAGGEVAERGEAAAARRRGGGAAAVDEPPVGDHGELQRRARRSRRRSAPRRTGPPAETGAGPSAEDRRGEPLERVLGALGLADALEGDDGDVAGAELLLELRLRLGEAAGGRDRRSRRGTRARASSTVGGERRAPRAAASGSLDLDVELGDVLVVDRRAGRRSGGRRAPGSISSAAAITTAVRSSIRSRKALKRSVGSSSASGARAPSPSVAVGERRLGEDPVVGVDLGGGVELDPLGLGERALGEGREVADRLDLVAEQLDPRGAVLGRAEDVEDPAADGELAAIGDLLDALVAAAGEQLGDVGEVDLLADG